MKEILPYGTQPHQNRKSTFSDRCFFHTPFFSNILSLFAALCLCLTLWLSLKGTAEVLRVSNQIPLADKAHVFQMLAVIHAAICAVDFFCATIHFPLSIIIYYILYITPIIFLSVAIYFAISAYRLVHVKEIDPKKIEEMRNRLQ